MLSCNDFTGNSQYGQQQDAYQGPPQQQGYPPQQQQYPGQQGYPGQQQGYGKSLKTQRAMTEKTKRDAHMLFYPWFYWVERPGLSKKAVCLQFHWSKTRKCRRQYLLGSRSIGNLGWCGRKNRRWLTRQCYNRHL